MARKRRHGEAEGRGTLGRERDEARFPAGPAKASLPRDYAEALRAIKRRIQEARLRVVLSANAAMVLLYWDLGRMILDRQDRAGWGAKVIDRLAADLRDAFPDMKGFSPRNLKYMRAFAAAWPERAFVQQVAAQIPWFHNCLLLDRVADAATREWYIKAAIQDGWSRSILALQISGRAHERRGKAVTNFRDTLPPAESDLAAQVFKDPYLFDFLGTADPRREREIEQALVDHIQRFLLELGTGFAFVGRQVPLEVDDQVVGKTKTAHRTKRSHRRRIDCIALFPVAPRLGEAPAGYATWLAKLKPRIRDDRLRVVLTSNAALVQLYWEIGRSLLHKQVDQGSGSRTIDRLAADLREAFPEIKGFSPHNLKYMRAFAAAWPDQPIVQAPLAQLVWPQNLALFEKLSSEVSANLRKLGYAA